MRDGSSYALFAEPDPAAAVTACMLASTAFYWGAHERFIGTPDWPEEAVVLGLHEAFAHAFILVLSALPPAERREFADTFYDIRNEGEREFTTPLEHLPDDPRARLALSAAIVLPIVGVIPRTDICTERILDLLQGAAQGDDLTGAPESVIDEVRKTVARIRLEPAFEDENDPGAAAALALAEVLAPAGEAVAVSEVLARSAWAAIQSWERREVIDFLISVDELMLELFVGT